MIIERTSPTLTIRFESLEFKPYFDARIEEVTMEAIAASKMLAVYPMSTASRRCQRSGDHSRLSVHQCPQHGILGIEVKQMS